MRARGLLLYLSRLVGCRGASTPAAQHRQDAPERTILILHAEVIQTTDCAAERRAEPRIEGPFPAVVLDAAGRDGLGAAAVLADLSAGGFGMESSRRVERGETLLVVAKVSHALVALRGTVLRVEPLGEGFRVAAAVNRYKFLSLQEV